MYKVMSKNGYTIDEGEGRQIYESGELLGPDNGA